MIKVNNKLIKILKTVHKASCPYDVNFHCHSTYSDGSLNPLELYKQANNLQFKNLAITDHHSIQAYKDICQYISQLEESKYRSTNIWPGIEITGILRGCLVHIIGLGFDTKSTYMDPYTKGNSLSGNLLQANQIISAISKSDGLSFLAHPARYRLPFDVLIEEAYSIGFDGVEVWYDYDRSSVWQPSLFVCEKINDLISKYNMLKSCGTDTHGLSLLSR